MYSLNIYQRYPTHWAEQNMAERKKKKKKDSQLIIRIDKDERNRFVELCDEQDTSAAREIRHFIREYLAKYKA